MRFSIKTWASSGVAIVAAANMNIPVFEYAARQVKQTVVGTGAAEKPSTTYG